MIFRSSTCVPKVGTKPPWIFFDQKGSDAALAHAGAGHNHLERLFAASPRWGLWCRSFSWPGAVVTTFFFTKVSRVFHHCLPLFTSFQPAVMSFPRTAGADFVLCIFSGIECDSCALVVNSEHVHFASTVCMTKPNLFTSQTRKPIP